MSDHKIFSKDLIKILSAAVENKIYGSVEVYFESGKITQVTQRIINKINQKTSNEKQISSASGNSKKSAETSVAVSTRF